MAAWNGASSNNQIKTKLDEMWKELQSNLPSVNFDNDTELYGTKDDDDDVIGDEYDMIDDLDNPKHLDDSDDEEKFIKFLNNDQAINNHLLESESREKLSPSAVVINNNGDDDSDIVTSSSTLLLSEFAKEFLSMRNGEKSPDANGNASHVSAEAAKITKNIFETTNSKLSMEIFETINIDKLLESVKSREKSSQESGSFVDESEKNSTTALSPRYLSEDEKVLKKLAEMSLQISKSDSDKHEAYDLKTGALVNPPGKPTRPKDKMVEAKTATSSQTLEEEDIDQRITNDLNRFLKQHNISNGNLVETRRIDLRASQAATGPTPFKHIYSKPTIESLLENIVLKEDDDHLFRNKPGTKMRYLNQEESESSSSDDDDDDGDERESRGLWIERFRQQKTGGNVGAKSS